MDVFTLNEYEMGFLISFLGDFVIQQKEVVRRNNLQPFLIDARYQDLSERCKETDMKLLKTATVLLDKMKKLDSSLTNEEDVSRLEFLDFGE